MNFTVRRAIQWITYLIRQPHRNGHGTNSSFLLDFVTKVLHQDPSFDLDKTEIEKLRKGLLKNKFETLLIDDFGAGSKQIRNKKRSISAITRYSSSSPKKCKLLHGIVNFMRPKITVELGTCLGFGTMYLATGFMDGIVFTMEGSKELYERANENFRKLGLRNILTRLGNFDLLLSDILVENGKFDLMFIDGNHTKEAVIRYFNECLPYAQSHSIIIFDDIRWSNDMYEAWLEICSYEKVKLSLDMFHIGLVFFNNQLPKQHMEIFY